MEVHGDQSREDQLMTNNTSGINKEIKVNEQKLETVTSFKYLVSVITAEKITDYSRIDKVETSLE